MNVYIYKHGRARVREHSLGHSETRRISRNPETYRKRHQTSNMTNARGEHITRQTNAPFLPMVVDLVILIVRLMWKLENIAAIEARARRWRLNDACKRGTVAHQYPKQLHVVWDKNRSCRTVFVGGPHWMNKFSKQCILGIAMSPDKPTGKQVIHPRIHSVDGKQCGRSATAAVALRTRHVFMHINCWGNGMLAPASMWKACFENEAICVGVVVPWRHRRCNQLPLRSKNRVDNESLEQQRMKS